MANAEHLRNLLQGPRAWNTYIESQTISFGANLAGADLTEANLIGANLAGADLAGANLREAYLIGADLAGATLTEANLEEATLNAADLTEANLREADLTKADLTGANLEEANLFGANLAGADLTGANLIGANLAGANLRLANLREAYLIGADLAGAALFGADLTRAVWDETTVWPDGFDPELTIWSLGDIDPLGPISINLKQLRGKPLRLKGPEGRGFKVTVDVGSSASFEELSQLLADLGLLSQVAASWATLEKQLTENDETQGDVLVKAPPKTGLGSEAPTIVSVTYRNPIDIVIASGGVGVAALVALLKVIPQCKRELAEARKADAETRKTNAEAAILERQLETQPEATSEFKATPTQIVERFRAIDGSLQAADRLSEYDLEVNELGISEEETTV